jgi:NAD-dependent SIR2 family protein deacetylase
MKMLELFKFLNNRNCRLKIVFILHRAPDPEATAARIPVSDLPQCHCGSLLRPHVVWFGESLDTAVLNEAGTLNSNKL